MVANRQKITDFIGNTPLVRINSLCELTGSEILIKCENLNPGGSVKDRAAMGMLKNALATGRLKPGMTIVEGTAGNTGIGLALVGRCHGFDSLIVMPDNQSPQKVAILGLYGAEVKLVKPCPFTDTNHFYHTAKRIAEAQPTKYWHADQFENLANSTVHYKTTGPEIWRQTEGRVDYLVSVAGTGGTIAGTSKYLKEKKPGIKIVLCDPSGSGLLSYLRSGKFIAEGSSFSEGIGIMRLVSNFAQAKIDEAMTLPDVDAVTIAYHLREHDGIVLGTSAALNVAACLKTALKAEPGKTIVTFWCDQAERSLTKLWDKSFLAEQGIDPTQLRLDDLIEKYS